MTQHSTTGVTPNMAMLGREVILLCSLIAAPPEEPHTLTVPYVATFQQNLRDAHHRVRESTRANAKTQKTYFDNRVRSRQFIAGQATGLVILAEASDPPGTTETPVPGQVPGT